MDLEKLKQKYASVLVASSSAFLLGNGADATRHDTFGKTAADWACQGGHHQIGS